jgi:hypothetical protein
MATKSGIDLLRREARRAARRLLGRALLARVFALLPLLVLYAVLALGAVKIWRLDVARQRPLLWLAYGFCALLLAYAADLVRRRQSPWRGSLALDEFHRLDDRVTTALAFSELPETERTPLMQAAIEDGVRLAGELNARRAVPFSLPHEAWLLAVLCAALVLISRLEVDLRRELSPPPAFEAMQMSADDVELFREVGKEFQTKSDDPATLAAARRFNQLVEDIAEHRLDRQEVFRRLGDLERDLKDAAELDQDALDQGLGGLARELEKSGLSKPAASALEQKKLADAEKAMRELADKLRRGTSKLAPTELEKLRKALEKASHQSGERLANIEARRRELEDEKKSLLKKKGDSPDGGAAFDPNAQNHERRLEHLDREKRQAERAAQQLSELDKQLADAARDLMKESGQSAQDLEQGAEDINRMAKQQASDEQKKDLLKRLQEMREVLRQQGDAGKEQLKRMMRFSQRARGQQQGESEQEGGDQPGGSGSGKSGGLRLTRGGSGPSVSLPVAGGQTGPSAGGGDKQPGGSGDSQGPGWGTGHDANLAGNATDLKGATHDVSAAGVDTGQGDASAQIIYGAAERGFVGRGYKKVFTDYQNVAERTLNQDEIPSGYRFYVRRYFQLIRPRE